MSGTRLLVVKSELHPLASENRQSVQKRFNPELAQLPLDHIHQVQPFLEVHLGDTLEKTGFFRAGVAGIAEQRC